MKTKSTLQIAAALGTLLLVAVGTATAAPASAVRAKEEVTLRELQVFDNFLDSHPAIDRELRKKPELARDPDYLSKHPDLKTFLGSHPGIHEEIRTRPRFFMRREEAFERSGHDITLAELRNFDDFLDRHQAIERDLVKDPALVRNAAYLSKHADLKDYLDHHAAIRANLTEHPKEFMRREKEFEKHEEKKK